MLRCRVSLGAAAAGFWRPPAGGNSLPTASPLPPPAASAAACTAPVGRRHLHARRVDVLPPAPRPGLASPFPAWQSWADHDRTATAAAAAALAALAAAAGRRAPGVRVARTHARPVEGAAVGMVPQWARVGAPTWPPGQRGLAAVLEVHAAAAVAASAPAAAVGTIGRLPTRREGATAEPHAEDYVASSTKKKRRAKMNKHKVRKRKKRDRKRT